VSQFLAGNGISAMDHLSYSPDLTPANFWLFPKLKSMLKVKHFSDVEDTKSSAKNILQTFMSRILKTVLNNDRITGNIAKDWREITLKKSRLLVT
jgi:hypothetical protein